MTREPKYSTSIAILLLFLRNGNNPRNVHRIMLEIPDLHLSNTIDKSGKMIFKVTAPSIASACRRLFKNGFLERIEAEPPRSPHKKMTPHYFLPINNEWNALRVSRLLLEKVGQEFISSQYGKEQAEKLCPEYVMGALNLELTSIEIKQLIETISDSPNAMSLSINANILAAVERLDGHQEDRERKITALFKYLDSARVIGIAGISIR